MWQSTESDIRKNGQTRIRSLFTHNYDNINKARREPSIKGRISFELDFNLSSLSLILYSGEISILVVLLLVVVDIRKM